MSYISIIMEDYDEDVFPESSSVVVAAADDGDMATSSPSGSDGLFHSNFTTPTSLIMMNLTSMLSNGSSDENYTIDGDEGGGTVPLDNGEGLELPRELTEMSESSRHCMIAYCILFVIATSGNLTVLFSVFKQYKKTKSRITLLILHLSIADLIVCCTLIPTEVFWRLTIQWRGGNMLCKACQFFRAFGLYLSSMVLICLSFDRFFAILFPMKMLKRQGQQRIKIMLWIAWIASCLFSAPQAILFSIAPHPDFPSFKQCVTNEFLKNTEDVRLYSIFSVSAMYFAPLVVIIFTYTAILIKIIRKSHQNSEPLQADDQLQQLHQRNRYSIRFRMSMRNSSAQRLCQAGNPNGSSGGTTGTSASHVLRHNHHQYPCQGQQQQQHNHSKLSLPGSLTGSRRKTHNSTSSVPPDQGDGSSEDGSYTGSTCSTMNVTSNNSNSNANTTTSGGGVVGGSGRFPQNRNHIHLQHQTSSTSTSPDVVTTLERVNSRRTTMVLRRSDNAAASMSRAKNRTLVMTIVIVVVFVLCWTPYVVMTLWYMFDWEGAQEVDPRIQDGLFVMAVANSCVNPIVYSFSRNWCGLPNILSRLRQARGQ